MSHTSGRATPTPRRGTGDEGTALVEFTFVAVLLLTIVFGIINFGLLLSFKQDMTRAAAEGARAGAVAFPASSAGDNAKQATIEAVDGFNRSCDENGDGEPTAIEDTDGMVCTITVGPCAPAATGATQCVTVELVYDYDDHPLLAKLPLIAALLPDTLRDSSVARLNS